MEITPELLIYTFSIYIITHIFIKVWEDIKEHNREG